MKEVLVSTGKFEFNSMPLMESQWQICMLWGSLELNERGLPFSRYALRYIYITYAPPVSLEVASSLKANTLMKWMFHSISGT